MLDDELKLKSRVERDISLWQELAWNDILGNMQTIFSGEANRTAMVMVQLAK